MPMPQIKPDTRREPYTFAGVVFQVPAPFMKGYILDEDTAAALNRAFAENLRNNFAKKVEKYLDGGNRQPSATERAELQAELDKFAASYEFGRAGGGRIADGARRAALELAATLVRDAIAKKGLKLKDYSKAKIRALAEDFLSKNPQFIENEKTRISQLRSSAIEIDPV